MLNNFVQPSSLSFGTPLEDVQPIQGFTSADNLAALIPSFKMPEERGKPEDEEKKPSSESDQKKTANPAKEKFPELIRLAMNVSFQEMIDFFLTPHHKEVFHIRNEIRGGRDEKFITVFSPSGSKPKNFEQVRKQLYMIHFQMFKTPKGMHFHIIV